MPTVTPGTSVPELSVDTVGGERWSLGELQVGFGLDGEAMSQWGLYVSSGLKDPEPERFSEPGLFLVDPSGKLFYAAVNSMPFGRPQFDEMLGGLDFVGENDYPPRGKVTPERVGA